MSRAERRANRAQEAQRARAASKAAPSTLDIIAGLAASGATPAARDALLAYLNRCGSIAEIAATVRLARTLGLLPAVLAAAERLEGTRANIADLGKIAVGAMAINANADAARLLYRAAEIEPDNAYILGLLGPAVHYSGDTRKGREIMERAVALDPSNALAQSTLGTYKLEREDFAGAISALSAAVAVDPNNTSYRINLGRAFIGAERYEDAFLMIQSALENPATKGAAFLAMAYLYRTLCDIDRVAYYHKQAVDAQPNAETITPYLFYTLASDAYSDAEVFNEHTRLAKVFDSPAALTRRHNNHRDPNRKLKIGFVSGDFYQHSVARFITPLIRDLDRSKFEVYGIYNNGVTDAATIVLKSFCDQWYVAYGKSDQTVAAWIEAQGIDVLIDLSGHTKLHRLSLFGIRPAPVQATYLGYPGTTGLRTMDYRITSEACDPTSLAEQYHTEKLIRMPGLLAPFQPQGDTQVAPSPHMQGAPFTFGCLNPIWRFTPSVLRAWGAILRARPDARMMLGNAGTSMLKQFLINKFAEQGVSADRLILEGRKNHPDYLALHNRIDLCLDTFPYNGGTTTTYSLWMGVPVVTLAGIRTAARSGACILSEAGLMDFIATTEEDYVARALDWASRSQDLSDLRQSTRERVKVSAPEDQALLAGQFGDVLRQMWRNWCASA